MKTIIKYVSSACFFMLWCFTSCDDNNSMHQQYIDQGETLYMGMVDSVRANPGNGRVQLSWWINADPRIDRTLIYWNDGADSISVPVNRTHSGTMKVQTEQQLPEGTYIFSLVTKDNEGHRSKSVVATVQIYGPKYIANLQNRSVQSQSLADNTLTLQWNSVESVSVQYATVSYTDYTDPDHPAPASVRVENDDTQTVLPGLRVGDKFSVATVYLPVGGIDPVSALPIEYTVR